MSDLTTFLEEWTTAEQDGDAKALDELLTDDFRAIGPYGFILPKPAWLARFGPDGLHYDAFSLDEVDVRTYDGAAVVTARQNTAGTHQGNPIPEATRVTLTTVERDGGWRLAGAHMSFIAGTAGAPPLPQRPG